MKALAGAAGRFKNLKQIWFCDNKITDGGLKALAEAAADFKKL